MHWSWFFVAWYMISTRSRAYESWGWNAAEYLGLFLIVLLHEFGHVLACRQTGGEADEIVLWPLGGIAFARPPSRAGAELWTIAAGPLVNVALWPVLMLATWACGASGISQRVPDLERLLFMLWLINKWLLIFNLLPIYPLDGGQILRSLLWFKLGRARSLQIAAGVGLVGIVGYAAYRVMRSPQDLLWTAFIAYFLGSQSLAGLRRGQALLALEKLPRQRGYACPSCQAAPPDGAIWLCERCGHRFDPFATRALCPHCQAPLAEIACVDCGTKHSLERWSTPAPGKTGRGPYIEV